MSAERSSTQPSIEFEGVFQGLPGPYFGRYGGQWMPESLMAALKEVTETYDVARRDPAFEEELRGYFRDYVNRPSLLTEVPRFAAETPGVRIFLKREDLNHTGSHKINNVIGQALLARRMGKTRLIAETGAGQHGVATATAAALFGMECTVYMGEEDTRRQALNVARMQMLGAEVIPVTIGARTLKDAINEALRDWVASVDTTHYLMGTVTGPHPYPTMVRYFHSVIGEEAREQVLAQTGRLPDAVAACVGGGSNAMGLFHGFLDDEGVELYGFEAGGEGLESGRHAASITLGRTGVLHGARTYLMQDEDGQTIDSHSISAGLDYPAVGPEHAFLHVTGPHPYPTMVRYFHSVIGEEAREQVLAQTGRLPDAVAACVGGGSNAMGLFHGFLDDEGVELYGFEAGGEGLESGRHAASITLGRTGVLHGARTYLMQDEDGQTIDSHSISAGLDYPAVGPEHAFLHDTGRAAYEPVTDAECMAAFQRLTRTEGILPAIESAHALAGALRLARRWADEGLVGADTAEGEERIIVVSLSGRGDKDVATAAAWFGLGEADEQKDPLDELTPGEEQ